ncbi:MAG TPA: branched-chain amino acid aminotransferase [Cytophagales bacterium]|nr:branched-chain amino acid aminotransferase [Cytophagales bacterium]
MAFFMPKRACKTIEKKDNTEREETMLSETTTIYLNGQWQEAHAANARNYQPTLHAGNGVFELIRAYGTENGPAIWQGKAHFERLRYSANRVHLELPYSTAELASITAELLQRNQLENAFIRAVVYLEPTAEEGHRPGVGLLLSAWAASGPIGFHRQEIMTSNYHLPHPEDRLPGAKEIGQHAHTLIATNEARKKGFDDALLLNAHGQVAGGPSANFFFELEDTLYTAPEGHIFPGITRATIIQMAQEIGYTVVETHFKPEEVRGTDAAFFTSTSHEIQGIVSLDGVPFQKEWEDTMGFNLLLRYRKAAREQALPLGII